MQTHSDLLAAKLCVVHSLQGCFRLVWCGEADETKLSALAVVVAHDTCRHDVTEGLEGVKEVVRVHLGIEVLDEEVARVDIRRCLARVLEWSSRTFLSCRGAGISRRGSASSSIDRSRGACRDGTRARSGRCK